jgi:hypothetical protein
VFVLAGGGRSGSTLVQRLLLSTGEIMVWGEHAGILLDGLQRTLAGMRQWIDHKGAYHLQRFSQEGWNAWIPNLNPPYEDFLAGARASLVKSLAAPAARMGYRRWGFKEIRYNGAAAALLKTLFPAASIIVLVRNPRDALRSIKVTSWYANDYGGRPESFLATWAANSASLATAASQLAGSLVLRYEDLIADPNKAVAAIAEHVGIDAERFDAAAIATRLRGSDDEAGSLDERDRAALSASEVREAAAALGYEDIAMTKATP